MCKTFSALYLISHELVFDPENTNSHEDLIDSQNLSDNGKGFVRLEYYPQDGNYADINSYKLHLDQQTRPRWFTKEEEKHVKALLRNQVLTMFVKEDRKILLGGCYIIVGNITIQKIMGSNIIHAGSATIYNAISATIQHAGSATIEHAGSATIEHAGSAIIKDAGFATIEHAGSATIEHAGSAIIKDTGFATIKYAGSATIKYAGSATIKNAGFATIRYAGFATIKYAGSATIKDAGAAIIKDAGSATITN